jgi:hydroxymethylpyrimidine kinase/phosphomethylpyrimidine kinase
MFIPKIMTIAGSDSGGGAGIQADLKTIASLGGYGTTVITALTAQNTRTVSQIHEAPTDMIKAQYEAIMEDIGADAIKIGMLSSATIISTVAGLLRQERAPHVVLDPVMISKSGTYLLREDAVEALITELLPLSTLLTPNIPETERLVGYTVTTDEDIRNAALFLKDQGVRASLIKGGHLKRPQIINTLYDGSTFHRFTTQRLDNKYTHGTGCTLSSAVATLLGSNKPLPEAVETGIHYVSEGLKHGYVVGGGTNPLNHMHLLQRDYLDPRYT